MSRPDMEAALKSAESDQFSLLFKTMCIGLSAEPENRSNVIKRFEVGVTMMLMAHHIAEGVLGSIIEDDKSGRPT